MLSEAKHPQYTVENKQMQILRCAQDDTPGTSPQPARTRFFLIARANVPARLYTKTTLVAQHSVPLLWVGDHDAWSDVRARERVGPSFQSCPCAVE